VARRAGGGAMYAADGLAAVPAGTRAGRGLASGRPPKMRLVMVAIQRVWSRVCSTTPPIMATPLHLWRKLQVAMSTPSRLVWPVLDTETQPLGSRKTMLLSAATKNAAPMTTSTK
jgi:hypothetical protein